MKKILLLFSCLQCLFCVSQIRYSCTKESALLQVKELSEIKKDIVESKKKGNTVVFDISDVLLKGKAYYFIKETEKKKYYNSDLDFFHIDKSNCALYHYNVVDEKMLSIEEWRLKNRLYGDSIDSQFDFMNLFNNMTFIDFTPKELNVNNIDIQKFKKKLEVLEQRYFLSGFYDTEYLGALINDKTYIASEHFVNSSWLEYFIKKYNVNLMKINYLMKLAIEREDFDAIKVLLENSYLISNNELNTCKVVSNQAKSKINDNKRDGVETYIIKESRIKEITSLLKQKYASNKISDPDGYTNLRKGMGTKTAIIKQVKSGEHIKVIDNTNNWLLVETMDGQRGYVYRDRVKSE